METTERFKVTKGLEILGFNEDVDYATREYILNEITTYIFDTKNTIAAEKVFDFELDYKYYYHDFLKLGINLNERDLSWWEFDSLLEDILLTDNTAMGKVLQYRTYKEPTKNPKQAEMEEKRFYQDMKRKYALKSDKKVENGLEKLWKNVESKLERSDE